MNKEGLSIIIITYNRKNELGYTLNLLNILKSKYPYEILVIDQNSSDGTSELFRSQMTSVRYIKLDENLGVAGGRNKGASLADYEYMVFIDDDAHFIAESALDDIFEYMDKENNTNLFAFQIRNLDNRLYNWPYPKKRLKHVDDIFYCNKYIGCGHAIKKTFSDKVGGYSDCLFFWGEEIEFVLKSFAITNMPVLYNGHIKMIHRVHGNGRNNTDAKRFYYQVRNRMYIIDSLLPKSAFLIKVYYKIGYTLKSYKNGWRDEYIQGIVDSKQMSKSKIGKLSLKDLVRYISLSI